MKKFILILAVFFTCISTIHAVTFNGTTTVSFPSFSTGTSGILYGYDFHFAPFQYGTPVYGKYNGGTAIGEFERSIVVTYGSGVASQSGVYWEATFNRPTDTSDKFVEGLEKLDDGSWTFYARNQDNTLSMTTIIGGVTQAQNNGCPGGNAQCVLVVNPVYTIVQTGPDSGVYLTKLDAYFFTDALGRVRHNQIIYTGSIYGFEINDSWNYWIAQDESLFFYDNASGRYSNMYWLNFGGSSTTANFNDNISYEKFMTGGHSTANTTLMQWLGSSTFLEGGMEYTTGSLLPPEEGFDSVQWYADCGSFLTDFTCYIGATFNNTIGLLFPTISFDGEFQSCDFALVTASGGFMQRFANVISVINPIPPDEGQTICMYFSGTGTMEYQRIIPEENFFEHFVPGALPQVEGLDITPAGQSIIDIFVIFGITMLIFHRKDHD